MEGGGEVNVKLSLPFFFFSRAVSNDILFGVHDLMFVPTIERLGTEEQKAKWLPLGQTYKILGTYAQTELGHGKIRY